MGRLGHASRPRAVVSSRLSRTVRGMTSRHWTAADLPDLTGKTVIVTGASSGIGATATRQFAGAGARVILAVRNVAKGTALAQSVAGQTEVRHLELADLSS